LFTKHKAGRHGTWGTDRAFYWTEPADGANPGDRDLYVCKTSDFGVNWTGIKHPMPLGPASDFVVSHSAFDNNGTFYVMHGDKLYVSFNGGESFAFTHTMPRYGSARRSDPGSDQFFVVDCGTIHIGLLEDAPNGNGRVYYLRGRNVDTANPIWDEELVDEVGFVRLDFLYIILDGNGIPTISYTTPDKEVTTASRKSAALSVTPCGNLGPLTAVSRKIHGAAGPFDVNLLGLSPGIEPRTGGPSGNHEIVITLPAGVSVSSISTSCGTIAKRITSGVQTTLELTGVPNRTQCSIDLHGVTNGTTANDVSIPIGFLIGDTNADRFCDGVDVSQTKSQSGNRAALANFREDVNIDGFIDAVDTALVKSKSGTALSSGPASTLQPDNGGSSVQPVPNSQSGRQSRKRNF
jgi:hypothetical protein